jgi:hypothetical protein
VEAIGDKVDELNRVEQQHYTAEWNRIDALIKKYKELEDQKAAAGATNTSTVNFGSGVSWQGTGKEAASGSDYTAGAWDYVYYDATKDDIITGSDGNEYVRVSANKDGKGGYAYVRVIRDKSQVNDDDLEHVVLYSDISKNNAVKAAAGGYNVSLYYKYAKGGYIDYTGPAWVDGTKGHPEYMLNAAQTVQFETLVAALDNMYSKNNVPIRHAAQNTGDSNCTFHINVEQMASDYDVDQLVTRIEKKMIKASQYRNVNILKKTQ